MDSNSPSGDKGEERTLTKLETDLCQGLKWFLEQLKAKKDDCSRPNRETESSTGQGTTSPA